VITLIAVTMGACSAYIIWQGFTTPSWGVIPSGVLGLLTAAGLVRGRRWAEPLAYAFYWLAAGSWAAAAAASVIATTRRIHPLEWLPGALLLLLSVGSCVVVFRRFHPRH
jgi:hypothetical protein